MLRDILGVLFGFGRNVVRETAEVFIPNAERQSQRAADFDAEVVRSYAAEFGRSRTMFDSFIDGVNRLPRPLMAFGVIGLLAMAVYDPEGFTRIMDALQAVPDALWALFGLVVTFFFGGRYQVMALRGQGWRPPVARRRGRDPVADWEAED